MRRPQPPRWQLRALVLATALTIGWLASAAESLRWDVPGAFMSVPIPGEQEALSVPLSLTAVRSRASVADLFNHFHELFERADLLRPSLRGPSHGRGRLGHHH